MKAVRPEDIPQVTHEGVMTMLGIEVRVFRLDDGRTVIEADDFHRLMAKLFGEQSE